VLRLATSWKQLKFDVVEMAGSLCVVGVVVQRLLQAISWNVEDVSTVEDFDMLRAARFEIMMGIFVALIRFGNVVRY